MTSGATLCRHLSLSCHDRRKPRRALQLLLGTMREMLGGRAGSYCLPWGQGLSRDSVSFGLQSVMGKRPLLLGLLSCGATVISGTGTPPLAQQRCEYYPGQGLKQRGEKNLWSFKLDFLCHPLVERWASALHPVGWGKSPGPQLALSQAWHWGIRRHGSRGGGLAAQQHRHQSPQLGQNQAGGKTLGLLEEAAGKRAQSHCRITF